MKPFDLDAALAGEPVNEIKAPPELHRKIIKAMPVPPECVTQAQYKKWLKETKALRPRRINSVVTFCEDCAKDWRAERIKEGKCSYFNLFGYFAWGKKREGKPAKKKAPRKRAVKKRGIDSRA